MRGRKIKGLSLLTTYFIILIPPESVRTLHATSVPPEQKIRSIASPFKGMKKNQLQYFNPDGLVRGTVN